MIETEYQDTCSYIVSSGHDRNIVSMTSQQYRHLNKIYIMIPPFSMLINTGEN